MRQAFTSADVDQALADAQRFKDEGNYEQALERHIWYHKYALKYAPAHYGVRLSFALGTWTELGQVYPKALDALRAIRDETLATYRKTSSDSLLLGEVMRLNFCLNDLQSAKELFYEVRKKGVDDPSLMLDLDEILAGGEETWARDVIGDPNEKLERIKDQRDLTALSMKLNKSLGDLAEFLDESYARQVATLLGAVEKTHGLSAARALQKQALKFLDSPIIRDALNGD
ncbi:MAG: hypothetical protein ABL962_21875 [Fimbriimonadaceae bacterium]